MTESLEHAGSLYEAAFALPFDERQIRAAFYPILKAIRSCIAGPGEGRGSAPAGDDFFHDTASIRVQFDSA
jgi:hypothetical protein